MKLANRNYHTSGRSNLAEVRWRMTALLIIVMISGLIALAVRPASAQTVDTPADPSAVWNIQVVEAPPIFYNMTDRSLRFDSAGNPHIAFGAKHLYYARWNPSISNWFITTVDYSSDVGQSASIAVDYYGNPRIIYYDTQNGALKFAYSQDQGYTWYPPFTITTFGPVTYAVQEPGNLTIEEIVAQHVQKPNNQFFNLPGEAPSATPPTDVDGYTSITVDGLNRIHVSYYDWNKRSLNYAIWDGVTWTFQTVDENLSDLGYDVGKYSSIAVDSNNNPHISYLDDKYDGLKYASSNGSSWSTKDIDTKQLPNYSFGGFTSLVLNDSNEPYISYLEAINGDMLIASPAIGGTCSAPGCRTCGPNGSWQCRIVDSSSYTGFYSSLGITSDETLMLSYYDVDNGYLRYAESSNGRSWSKSTLISSDDSGLYTSLAVDYKDNPGITYFSAGTGLYSFIRWNGSNWVNSGIIYSGNLGPLTSLTINPASNVSYISYFNDTGDQLKMGTRVGASWYRSVVDTNSGDYSSIRTTQSGEPRIAYHDLENDDLVYAYRVSGVWYFQTVDDTEGVGTYPSLALGPGDVPYISYYDSNNASLKFAYYNGTAWVLQTVESSTHLVGTYNSLTLNKNSSNCFATIQSGVCPMISYYDATDTSLKVAYLSIIGAWVTQVVDNSSDVGQYSSIALDNAGALHISYYDATNGWLKHAQGSKGGSAWSFPLIEVVDNTANVGQYSSIIADTSNNLHVSYYNATTGDLKYALKSGGVWTPQTIDSNDNVGIGTSISLFSTNQPGISYFDATNGALKFATTFSGLSGLPYYFPLVYK